jgi:hypothetical protein
MPPTGGVPWREPSGRDAADNLAQSTQKCAAASTQESGIHDGFGISRRHVLISGGLAASAVVDVARRWVIMDW